jgi:hypothetical protein
MHARWIISVVVAAVVAAFLAGPAQAGTGPVMTLPVGGVKAKSGLDMSFDCQGVDGNGYRPIRVEIKPIGGKPLTADRQLRIVLTPQSYSNQQSPSVTQIVELPEGSTAVTATIVIPQSSLWYGMGIETYEDGELLRDLTQPYMGWTGTNSWDWTEARPSILIIDGDVPAHAIRDAQVQSFRYQGVEPGPTHDLPDFRNLVSLFPDPNRGGPGGVPAGGTKLSDAALLAQVAELSRVNLVPPAELPPRWIELSQYDVAVVSLADLRAMSQRQRPQATALADWAAGGTLLIVSGVGEDFAGLAEVERLLELPRLPSDPNSDERFRGWTPADNDRHRPRITTEIDELDQTNQYAPYPGVRIARPAISPGIATDRTEPDGAVLPAPETPPFAMRSIGLGRLVAIAADEPFPGDESDWVWIFNSVPRHHWMWYQRNGFSLYRKNDDYWTFLIPGVGEAPVLSFVLLVSLFAVLIGPVNYTLLKRAKRLYLLLLTVPIGAAIVTAALFSYALVTDGLGVRVRARSFTDLDQRTGRAVSWSRQSYYAALAPSRGLSFPDDATVFPLIYEPEKGNGPGAQRALTWDGGQNLRRGYLASRTTTQYVVMRTTRASEQLAVQIAFGRAPQVENRLGAHVQYILLCDPTGAYWEGGEMARNASRTLSPTILQTGSDRLQKLFRENPLALPHGYDPDLHSLNFDWSQRRYYGYASDSGAMQPLMATSILESNLVLASRPTLDPPANNTYLAVIESSPVVPFGVPRVRQEASLHVIRGRW